MATVVYCFLLLLAVCGAIQQRSPRGADYSNYEEEVKIILPDSFNEALPNIQGLQRDMVSLMNKTLISQENVEDKLGNNEIVSVMNKTLSVLAKTECHLENIAASQNESIVLNDMTLKSQELIETHLQNMEVILPDIQDSQNDMVSLMNKTLILQEDIVDKLPDIQESQNDMVSLMNKSLILQEKGLGLLENRLDGIEVSLQDIAIFMENSTKMMWKMMELMQSQINTMNAGLSYARECQDISVKGIDKRGSYIINPSDGLGPFKVFCDFTDDHIWTVFQRRYDGSVNFYRNWAEYENGFGDANGEYWLGLKNIHRLISDGSTWALSIDLESFDGESAYALYDTFSISDAASNYRLAVGEYSGTAGDSLKNPGDSGVVLNGMQFSTFDRDNDRRSSINCASYNQGAFWYNGCHYAHLNGKYLRPGTNDWKGMIWYTWKQTQSLKTSEMKIRRVL